MFDNPLFDVPTILLPSHSHHRMNISLLLTTHFQVSRKSLIVRLRWLVKVGACGNFPVYDTALSSIGICNQLTRFALDIFHPPFIYISTSYFSHNRHPSFVFLLP